jgi:hypothetical protein
MNDLAENAIEKISVMKLDKSELANEVLRLRKKIKDSDAILKEKETEIERINARVKPDFIIETKVTSDRRIRFSAPEEIKSKLKPKQKILLEVRLLSPNSQGSNCL